MDPAEPWQNPDGSFNLVAITLPCAPGTGYTAGPGGPCITNVPGCSGKSSFINMVSVHTASKVANNQGDGFIQVYDLYVD